MSKITLLLVLSLAVLVSACGVNASGSNLPGPTVTDEIRIPAPDAPAARLTLEFGVGELSLSPGAEDGLVSGTAVYNLPAFKPVIETDGADVFLRQGEAHGNTFVGFDRVKNEWTLQLGSQTMALDIRAGAYKGTFDLGGLALTSLTVSDGASDVTLDFSAPNLEKMSLFTYKTGASNVTLKNLANAGFVSMVFESGAGNYRLDFGGELQRDASVVIRSGMSNLTLLIPPGPAVTVRVNEGFSNVQVPAGWSKSGNLYTRSGAGAAWTIVIEMGAGNVQIVE